MRRYFNLFVFLIIVALLTSCASNSANPQYKPDVPEEIQLLDTTSNQVLYIGMKKSEINSKKLVEVEDDYAASKSAKVYQYEGINMMFMDDNLIFMHISEKSKKGRFKTKGIGIGSDVTEIESAYGHTPIHNPYFDNYSFIILKEDLYYFKSLDDMKERRSSEPHFYMVDFNGGTNNKIRSFNLADDKYHAPSE